MLLPTYTLLITLLLISFHDSEQFLPLLSRCPCHETKPDQIGRSGLLVLLSQSNNGNDQSLDNNNNNNNKQQKKKGKSKSKKIVINTKLVGEYNISSDGLLTNRKTKQKEAKEARDAVKSNLGVPGRKKKPSSNNDKSSRKLSKKAQKLKDERTAYGTVDGTLQAGLAVPEDQEIQVQEVKRGNKQVTIVRGFTCSMEERKKLLKEIKKRIGGGGSLIEGIVEVQGSHSDVVLKTLKSKGYTQAAKK